MQSVQGNFLSQLPTKRTVDGMAEAYVQEKLKKVRRELFCDDRPRSPGVVQRSDSPLSYSLTGNADRTVFFMGFKLPSDTDYKCQTCFCANNLEVKDNKLDGYIYTGEISEQEFLKRGEPFTVCSVCNKYLTIVRPYDSAHLDFA